LNPVAITKILCIFAEDFAFPPISSKKIDIKKDILNRPLDYIQSIGCFSQTLQYLFSNIRKFIFEH
jgi:hypothetical protein